jgi:hypothetical protein
MRFILIQAIFKKRQKIFHVTAGVPCLPEFVTELCHLGLKYFDVPNKAEVV